MPFQADQNSQAFKIAEKLCWTKAVNQIKPVQMNYMICRLMTVCVTTKKSQKHKNGTAILQ